MRTSRPFAALFVALLLSGCLAEDPTPDAGPSPTGSGDAGAGDAGAGDAGAGDAGPGDAGPGDAGEPVQAADEVVITRRVPYVTGSTVVLDEPVQLPVEVLVPTASGYTRLSGSEVKTGYASVRGVPTSGSYLVRSGNAYVYTSARRLNRGWARAERPGVELADGGVTSAELTITGLSPWNEHDASDSLAVVGLETGSSAYFWFDPEPATGSTSLSSAAATISPQSAALMSRFDASKDTVAVFQHVVHNAGTDTQYTSARNGALVAAPDFDGTGPLRLSAALDDLPQTDLTVDLRFRSFCDARSQVHPDATLYNLSFTVMPAAYGVGEYGWVGYSGELLVYSAFFTPGVGAEDLATTFSYGNPFPASWGQVASADCAFRHRLTLPSGKGYSYTGVVGVTDVLARLVSGPITPTLLPPTSLQVDGTDASAARTLASLTPTVSWAAPTHGTPTRYRLDVFQLVEVPTSETSTVVRRKVVASVDLPASVHSLRLPEGILEPASHYFVRVIAAHSPNFDITRYETAQMQPHSTAETATGLLSTP